MNRPVIQALDICKSYGFHEVIRGINLVLRENDKVALVGPNGVGKSTLLKILAGIEAPSFGSVKVFKERLTLRYVPQDPTFDLTKTPREMLSEKAAMLGPGARASVMEALSRFHLAGEDADLYAANLSGGQKTRLALALTWMERPDILLLDEPTNHLDQDGLVWLEKFVRDYPGTVMVVSHDRYFLDNVVSRVIELAPDHATEYDGNYTSYRNAKAKAFADQLARYESEQKEIRRIEAAIDRQMRWFEKSHRHAGEDSDIRKGTKEFYRARAKRMARRAKSTIKRLEAMKKVSVEKPRQEKAISPGAFKEEAGGRRMILADGVSKAFDRLLFGPSSFSVLRGEKVGIVGLNGAGKTTLLRMISGKELPSGGTIWVSPGVRIGYLDQEMSDLNVKNTVLEEILDVLEGRTQDRVLMARTILSRFLFTPEDLGKYVKVLSTGERKRIALIKLLLSGFNLLIMDEPTEHLDLPSREKLEEALVAYGGTLLLVSHDRYLLRKVSTKILAIEGQRINTYLGGFDEYQRKIGADSSVEDSETEASKAADERLLLQTRLARLNSELAMMPRKDPRYSMMEAEFFAIAGLLRRRGTRKTPQYGMKHKIRNSGSSHAVATFPGAGDNPTKPPPPPPKTAGNDWAL